MVKKCSGKKFIYRAFLLKFNPHEPPNSTFHWLTITVYQNDKKLKIWGVNNLRGNMLKNTLYISIVDPEIIDPVWLLGKLKGINQKVNWMFWGFLCTKHVQQGVGRLQGSISFSFLAGYKKLASFLAG